MQDQQTHWGSHFINRKTVSIPCTVYRLIISLCMTHPFIGICEWKYYHHSWTCQQHRGDVITLVVHCLLPPSPITEGPYLHLELGVSNTGASAFLLQGTDRSGNSVEAWMQKCNKCTIFFLFIVSIPCSSTFNHLLIWPRLRLSSHVYGDHCGHTHTYTLSMTLKTQRQLLNFKHSAASNLLRIFSVQ